MGMIVNKQSEQGKHHIADLSRKTALVVDDFGNFRLIIKNMLQSFGITNIDQASNGEHAIGMIRNKKYDIILCDFNLGDGKNGQQVFEEAKHGGFITAAAIFIMVTAENTMHRVLGAMEQVPDDYLVKPFTNEVLINRLGKVLKKKEAFASVQEALDRKDYQEVINRCDEGVLANPTNPYEFLKIQAEVFMTMGQYDEARAVYDDVLKQREIIWATMGIGKLHFYKEQYAEARDVFQSVLDKNRMYMEAYDWLAQALDKLDLMQEVQQTLVSATNISPNVLARQRALGEVAYKNKDFDVSAQSFRSAISLGKNSDFKSSSEYMGLAKVLIDTDFAGDALKIVDETKQVFKDNPEAMAHSSAVESMAYHTLGDVKRAEKATEEGSRFYAEVAGNVSSQTALDLAKAFFFIGQTTEGTKLMQEIIKNNYGDARILKDVQQVFTDANLKEKGATLINVTSSEMIQLNNKGVDLAKEGKLEEAIDYLEKAAIAMPGNKIINTNAAYTMLHYMKQKGRDDALLKKAQFHLDRVRSIDPHYKMYVEVLPLFYQLQREKTP
jgi:CheY-like chemotaxis protein